MKRIIIAALAALLVLNAKAQTTWVVEPVHSKVGFTVEHLVISEVDGTFKTFDGKLVAAKKDFTDGKISFTIDVASVNTDNERRDGHLKSEDFFYAEKYPNITFESTSFKKVSDEQYELTGNLTMRGVTKEVTLSAKYGGEVVDGYGYTRVGFIVKGSLNRIDYGVAWNAQTQQGGLTVGEEVDITVKLEMVKQ